LHDTMAIRRIEIIADDMKLYFVIILLF